MKNSSKGITLIALIITIIILLILAGVTISQLTENGLLYKAIKAKDQTQKMQAKEELESVLIEAAIEKQQNEKYNSNDFLNQFIISKISGAQINENNVLIKKYTFLIDRELLKIISVEEIQNNEEKTDLAEINDEELNSLDINMNFLGLNLAQIPTRSGDWKAFIIPVLYVLVSVISLRITNPTPKKKDGEEKNSEDEFDPMAQMNKNMNLMFPVMYLAVALIAPLGLALYWLMNSLLMIIERLALNKMLKDEEE